MHTAGFEFDMCLRKYTRAPISQKMLGREGGREGGRENTNDFEEVSAGYLATNLRSAMHIVGHNQKLPMEHMGEQNTPEQSKRLIAATEKATKILDLVCARENKRVHTF